MAELTAQERLQPSLLDRLTDDEPGNTQESRDKRVLSLRRLREGVIRDLAWLLNTVNLASVNPEIGDYPAAAGSVLNYGVPDLTGHTASTVEPAFIEQGLRQAIWDFEPRILRNTLRVHVGVSEHQMSHNTMTIEIEGEIWAQPVPERLFLKTEIDLETGSVAVYEHGGRIGG